MAAAPDPPCVAIVTGAARGIGRATTLRLVSDGWSVVAVDRAAIADVEREDRIYPLSCDLTVPDAPRDIVAKAMDRFGFSEG